MATIVGIHDAHGRQDASGRRAAVTHALGDIAPGATILSEETLTIASHGCRGPARLGSDGPVCLIDGYVSGLPELAEELGLPTDGSPEELVGAIHERLGESPLTRLRGDFVLVVWYPRTGTGMIACDQFGMRSLVFHQAGDRMRFASETRELLRMLPQRPAPDELGLPHWLAGSFPPGDRTLYAGVRRLRAAHFLRLGPDGVTVHPYWSPQASAVLPVSREEAGGLMRDAVVQAVERRYERGATGATLSGGLDSSTVAAVAARLLPADDRPLATYSAVFPRHPSVDESSLIEGLARDLGLPNVRIAVDGGSVLRGGLEYIQRWELPPVSPNLFFWLPLFRRARADGVTVLLDGEGGDEIFGFSPYLLADRLARGRLRSAVHLAGTFPGDFDRPQRQRLLARLSAFGLGGLPLPPALRRARRALRAPQDYAHSWLRPDDARAYFDTQEEWLWKDKPGPRWATSLAHRFTWSFFGHSHDHLRRRAAMVDLDSRHPLIDVDLLELVLRLPPELSFDRRFTRPLIRDGMAGILPDNVRLRLEKSMFDEVFHESLRTVDLPVARRLLTAPDAEIGAYADLEIIRRELFEQPRESRPDGVVGWALEVWRLLTAECWLRNQAEPGFAERLRESEELAPPTYRLLEPVEAVGDTYFFPP